MNEETIRQILDFRHRRNWEQFHNPKDLAISISIEASELLENFQWKSSEDAIQLKKEQISEELADVLIYSVYLAEALKLDINEFVLNKLNKNEAKYPVEKSFGKKDKYTEL